MSISVVAVFSPKPGRGEAVVDAFRAVAPLVHAEPGCELYAVHVEQGGDTVVMVERWASRENLDAHAAGMPLARLGELTEGLLTRPYDVWFLDPVPIGEPIKGTIPVSTVEESR